MTGMDKNVLWILACSLLFANGQVQAGFFKKAAPFKHSAKVIIRPGHRVSRVPQGAISVVFAGAKFFVHGGVYYKWNGRDYVVVKAPIGMVVSTLPPGYEVETLNGSRYYSFQGVYYRRVNQGYLVVNEPVPVIIQPMPTINARANTPTTVWIANPNGSQTPVEITPNNSGQWIGPKGEYYTELPTEAQLRPVYGVGAGIPEATTIWLYNENGSKTPVVLKPLGEGRWEGPHGEEYRSLPTEEELRYTYGLQNQ